MNSNKELEVKQKMEQSKDIVINAIAETMDIYGLTTSIGCLYGTMYFNKDPMTLDEMKNELGMSKPSMSKAVRKLSEDKMVKKVWQKGSRKDFYSAEKDFFKSFVYFFCKKWEREVAINLEAILTAEENLKDILSDSEVNGSLKEESRYYYEQLNKLKKYYYWLERLSECIKSGEIFKYIPME